MSWFLFGTIMKIESYHCCEICILFIRIVIDESRIRDHHMEMFRLQLFWKTPRVYYLLFLRSGNPLPSTWNSWIFWWNLSRLLTIPDFSCNVKIRAWGKYVRYRWILPCVHTLRCIMFGLGKRSVVTFGLIKISTQLASQETLMFTGMEKKMYFWNLDISTYDVLLFKVIWN